MKKHINVIAHRGANRKAPQNTLPAFRQAIDDGCDGFETDVHLSRDGVPVICHNYTIDAMSDGKGAVASYTLDELKLFDFGRKFSDDFIGTQLPTLDEFLELVTSVPDKIINIELKCPRDGADKLVRLTLDAIDRFKCLDRIIISSFSPEILKLVKKYVPACKTAYLFPTTDVRTCPPVFSPFILAKSIKADIIHPMAGVVNPVMVAIAHKLGMQVNVWTVNDRTTVSMLVSCGVDGIITDCTEQVRKYLEDMHCH